jgi:N-acetylmuramic acid 6-phosphate etherase
MFGNLLTEQRNPASKDIDTLSTEEMLAVMNDEDARIFGVVRAAIPQIANAVDGIAGRIRQGGRLFYIGAGTSGRLGVLDASECPPTFNVASDLVVGVIAGGEAALARSSEASEDDKPKGASDLSEAGFAARDAVVGIAASGRTPYVLGAVEWARQIGALTSGISCSPGSELARAVEIAIELPVGPEVVTGSTRMKAGTATKLALNMISTGVMIRLGYVYSNLMVNVQPTNVKLRDRAIRIIAEAAAVPYNRAEELIDEAGSVKTAIVMAKRGESRAGAEQSLADAGGILAKALNKTK